MSFLLEPLLGARVRLRPIHVDDQRASVALRMDPRVRQHLGGPVDAAEARARFLRELDAWGHFAVCDLDGDEMIGTVSFGSERGAWEVSYAVQADRWGVGLGREAVALAVGWFRRELGDVELIAVTQLGNERSRRLLVRLGGKALDEFEEYGMPQVRYVLPSVPGLPYNSRLQRRLAARARLGADEPQGRYPEFRSAR
jgi:RimJ/RimL family protein N-acetyltransferase